MGEKYRKRGKELKGQLIGFLRFKSKKGNPVCKAYVGVPATDRQLENGSSSTVVEDIYLLDDFFNFLKETDCGHEIDYSYNRKGFLERVEVL